MAGLYSLSGDEQECMRILTAQRRHQPLVDRIHSQLASGNRWRLAILPVDGALPAIEDSDEQTKAERARSTTATREELYNSGAGGSKLDGVYLLLVALSTLVAGIGLVSDNVAIVVGAMVIAPLLGPNLACALGAPLGDRTLMASALHAGAAGISLAILLAAVHSLLVSILSRSPSTAENFCCERRSTRTGSRLLSPQAPPLILGDQLRIEGRQTIP